LRATTHIRPWRPSAAASDIRCACTCPQARNRALPLLLARAFRAFGDGYVAVLLPVYLLALGLGTREVGIGFAATSSFWPLLVVAFVGTLNPSPGDVSVFLPLEHASLAGAARADARTALFARYSVLGALCAALGALASAVPDWLTGHLGLARIDALRGMFVAYGAIGAVVWWLCRRLPAPAGARR